MARMSSSFRSWSGPFFGGVLAEINEHFEAHRDNSATILALALTSLRFDAALLRNIHRVATAVGAESGRARRTGSVSPSPPTI